ncbi:MAG TPA: GDSL-type esterase/lipase family protein [Mucilaginibacter sp.]|jgi:lysophospholipase L1-like esterase|nr:GDSL-type esterase/lipase family protein [Mucilaginibacter sp.]
MRGIQIAFIFIIAISGCIKKAASVPAMPAKTATTTTMTDSLTYLALGDSYTIGEAVPQNQSFPYQLVSSLKSDSFSVQPPAIIATTGWTADNLISAIAASSITNKKFDFVTLLIGVNDQFQGLSQSNYRVKFIQLLNTAINFAKGDASRVFVLSIPDYGVTPFAGGNDSVIGPQIDQFNAINKTETLKAGVAYVDITDISRQAANDPALIAPDGLHPAGKMYGLWIQRLEPLVAARLKK